MGQLSTITQPKKDTMDYINQKEPPTLKSLMQEYEALFRQYRLENRDDYDIDATVAYRMADIANDVRGFAKAGGDDYAVMQMAEELDYFKELIEREKANR
jgi:hypothetical protein